MGVRRGAAYVRHVLLRPRSTIDAVRWRLTLRRLGAGLFGLPVVAGSRDTADSVAVIVCLWNRPERLEAVLRNLDSQGTTRPIRLLLWNNNRADHRFYRTVIDAYPLDGALSTVQLHSNRINIGGLARFIVARKLLRQGYSGSVLMFDDDQELGPDVVEALIRASGPRRINGWWAFNHRSSYWDREPAAPGEPADHVGTGGCAVDASITGSMDFFTRLPRRYAFLEDQWMCAYAHEHCWTVVKTDVDITAVLESTNQYHALVPLKDEFWSYLGSRSSAIVS